MKDRNRRLGLGAGAILAVVAVALLMPLPVAGGLRNHLVAASLGKGGGLQQIGRTMVDPPSTQVSGDLTNLGTRELPPDTTVPPSTTGPATVAASPTLAILPPVTSPQLQSQFGGLTQATSGHALPPDTQVAVNGTYVFELVNERARITSFNGSTVYRTFTIQGFFGTTFTDKITGVQVFYDTMSKRWVFSADDRTTNSLKIAVSKTSNPTGAYWAYAYTVKFGSKAQYMDQPVLGGSKTRFAWDTNQLNKTTNVLYGTIVAVFDKHKLEMGVSSWQYAGWSNLLSLHPARQLGTNGSGPDVLYAATTGLAGPSTTLTVAEFKGSLGNLTSVFVTYSIANTGYIPSAPQPGTGITLWNGDTRVESVGWSTSGILWVSYTTACTPAGDSSSRSCIRVDAVYTGVAGLYLFYGALTPAPPGGGYLMVLGYSGALVYPSIAMSGQNVSDAYGTYRGPIPAFSGSSYDATGQFGDYSGIQLVPGATKTTAIAASEYDGPSGWATEVVHFTFY
jgi:hypothetical protein